MARDLRADFSSGPEVTKSSCQWSPKKSELYSPIVYFIMVLFEVVFSCMSVLVSHSCGGIVVDLVFEIFGLSLKHSSSVRLGSRPRSGHSKTPTKIQVYRTVHGPLVQCLLLGC